MEMDKKKIHPENDCLLVQDQTFRCANPKCPKPEAADVSIHDASMFPASIAWDWSTRAPAFDRHLNLSATTGGGPTAYKLRLVSQQSKKL